MSLVVEFPGIYLVATGHGINGTHRVTKRPITGVNENTGRKSYGRAGEIQFSGRRPDEFGEAMGVLILTEEKWNKWFGDKTPLSGMETAEKAAKKLVKENSNISYGCPLCAARFTVSEESRQHIEDHVNSLLSEFEVEVVEKEEND